MQDNMVGTGPENARTRVRRGPPVVLVWRLWLHAAEHRLQVTLAPTTLVKVTQSQQQDQVGLK